MSAVSATVATLVFFSFFLLGFGAGGCEIREMKSFGSARENVRRSPGRQSTRKPPVTSYEYKREHKSKDQLEKECNKGDAKSCRDMANRLISSDPVKAAKFLKKACDANDGMSCFYLGRAHDEGKGVPKDRAESTRLFEKACAGGFKKACANVGMRVMNTNPARAVTLFVAGCEVKSKFGCAMAGVMYRDGKGVPVDKVKAKQFFNKSCLLGLFQACKAAFDL